MTEDGAASNLPRWLGSIGRAATILLLISCVVPNLFLLMLSTAPGGGPVSWLVTAHVLMSLYSLMLLLWRRNAPGVWPLVLGLGLLPWVALVALLAV